MLDTCGRWSFSYVLCLCRLTQKVMDSERQTSHDIISSPNFGVTSLFFCSSVSGPFPISLQFGSEGSAEEPATGKHYKYLSRSEK